MLIVSNTDIISFVFNIFCISEESQADNLRLWSSSGNDQINHTNNDTVFLDTGNTTVSNITQASRSQRFQAMTIHILFKALSINFVICFLLLSRFLIVDFS